MKCYVFETESAANGALNLINSNGIFPITARNAKTGELEPGKQKTEKWVDAPQQRVTDNKWFFSRIPDVWRNMQTQEQIDYFNAAYPNTIENYSSDWIPASEEI